MQREILASHHLKREVLLDVVLPKNYHLQHLNCKLLVFNGGQETPYFHLKDAILDMESNPKASPIIAISIHAHDTNQAYGITDGSEVENQKFNSTEFALFVENELIPWAYKQFRILPGSQHAAMAGFSFGALSAFDVVLRQPHIFGSAGLFSGNFWWQSVQADQIFQPMDRIAIQWIGQNPGKKNTRFWFQTSWLDETADRDSDGLIDAIGDTLDVIRALQTQGYQPGTDIEYVELGSGQQDMKSISKALPRFLQWFAGKTSTAENISSGS